MDIVRHDILPRKPLVEAILEIKWGELSEPDQAYPIIVGRLYERLRARYAVIQDLPIVRVPPDMTIHVVRHQFRSDRTGWPLVQVGPGILTLNDTDSYTWADFREQALKLHPELIDSHPAADSLNVTSLMLQYIDAVEFDFERGDVREFLQNQLHIGFSVPDILMEGQPVGDKPTDGLVQVTFPALEPKGRVQLRVLTGRKNDKPAIIWHTLVRSVGDQAAQGWKDFPKWLDAAHQITDHWFFALIQGDLLEEFLKP
jgi:uncharacterized protein (TIGR04255 family)